MNIAFPREVLLGLVLVGCTYAGYLLLSRRKSRVSYRKSLPSPPGFLPKWVGKFGGHMLLLKRGKIHQQFEDWADEFGGSYELFVFGSRRIFVVDPAESRRILARRPGGFERGSAAANVSTTGAAVGIYPALFFDEGAAWGRSRRLIAPHFSGHNVRSMVPAMVKIARRLCEKWSTVADGDGIVDAKDDLGRFTHDVIALIGFRYESRAISATAGDNNPLFEALGNILGNFQALLLSPFHWFAYKFLPFNSWVRRLSKEKAVVHKLVKGLCDTERRLIAAENDTNSHHVSEGAPMAEISEGMLLRKLVKAGDDGAGEGRMLMPDDEVVSQARSLFLAGQETTSLALAWCTYFLAKHPEVLARCRQEVTRNVASSDGVVTDFEETTRLVYLTAVFKETLRLKNTVPFLAVWAKSDYTMLNGATYPRGTSFSILSRYMSTREAHFTRADEFIPARWIEAEREEALLGRAARDAESGEPRVVNHVEEAFFPFGGGPRICPGMGMANLEGLILLAALCVQFDFALAPDQEDPPRDWFSVTCGPENLKLRLAKRKLA